MQILFVYLGGAILRTVPLTARELGIAAGAAGTVFFANLLYRLGARLFCRKRGKRKA